MQSAATTGRPARAPFRPGASRALLAALAFLSLLPAMAQAWWNGEWAYRKQITLNPPPALPAGTGLADVPLLIRLHEGVLPFQDVAADGADLRFVAEDDKTPLRFHVEKFDPVFNLGFVWVQLPKLQAGAPVSIWLYYGNPGATSGAEPERTWDASQTLVYHFAEVGAPASDSTAFANTSSGLFVSEEGGLVGGAARFDGQGLVQLPATPSLAVAQGGALTLSMWVKPAAPGTSGVLYSQRDATGALEIGLAGGAPYVEVIDALGQVLRSDPATPLSGADWQHLALVAGEGEGILRLYVDGNPGPALAADLPALAGAATIGARRESPEVPVQAGFTGAIDEFRLAKAARPAAAILLDAQNQGPLDAMVEFGVDEGQSHTGYIGIILGSLTIDGWAVIVLCIVMMVVSWYIMWIKAAQVSQVHRSNALFLELYRASHGDFIALERDTMRDAAQSRLSGRQRTLLQKSPLLHIFRDGVSEMRHRLHADNSGELRGYLSPQSIQAIRATIDSRLVRENQVLGSLLVLLTIAISGGPFIGLLGTVVGVMITFAGVAAAGDVNINAIAPGISAALAATVAGLMVAIPSLFGYNYLVTRNKETTAQMHVFVDSLVTRMAESYSNPNDAHR